MDFQKQTQAFPALRNARVILAEVGWAVLYSLEVFFRSPYMLKKLGGMVERPLS
jgi:hypothetical protein